MSASYLVEVEIFEPVMLYAVADDDGLVVFGLWVSLRFVPVAPIICEKERSHPSCGVSILPAKNL